MRSQWSTIARCTASTCSGWVKPIDLPYCCIRSGAASRSSSKTFSNCSKEPMRTGCCRGPCSVTPRKAVTPVSTASSRTYRSPADSMWTPGDLYRLGIHSSRARGGSGRSAFGGGLRGFVDLLVDLADLLDPHVPLVVLHVEDVVHVPVEVIGDVRYLAGELVQRVAYDSPSAVAPVPMSTWHSWPQPVRFELTLA